MTRELAVSPAAINHTALPTQQHSHQLLAGSVYTHLHTVIKYEMIDPLSLAVSVAMKMFVASKTTNASCSNHLLSTIPSTSTQIWWHN